MGKNRKEKLKKFCVVAFFFRFLVLVRWQETLFFFSVSVRSAPNSFFLFQFWFVPSKHFSFSSPSNAHAMTILASLCLFLLFFGGVRLDFGEDLTIKRPVLEITTCESPIAAGPVLVDRNGVHEDHYIVVSGGLENNELLVPSKKSFSIGYGTTAFLAKACVREFGPDIYSRFYLLGKTIQYTVDLSYCSCGCNMALYLVSMPGCHPGDAGLFFSSLFFYSLVFLLYFILLSLSLFVFLFLSLDSPSFPPTKNDFHIFLR